jgi:glycosyltransferase involved in cell wall biosynthesis
MAKITFIVSAYDRPLALNLCLLSLVLQKDERWDAIVTDNSTNPSLNARHQEICGIDKRFQYLHTANVAGVNCYSAANHAIQFATGEFVGFPSDDSYFVPEYADKLLRNADAYDLELVYADLVMTGYNDGGILVGDAQACHLDKTNFILKRSRFIPFSIADCADGELIAELVKQGIRHRRVGHPLAVHNTDRRESHAD